jgi:hypothetical protein
MGCGLVRRVGAAVDPATLLSSKPTWKVPKLPATLPDPVSELPNTPLAASKSVGLPPITAKSKLNWLVPKTPLRRMIR